MQTYTGRSNQWGVGIGLRRSTVYGSRRWMLWVNYGYLSKSWSWSRNPERPASADQGGAA